MKKNNLLKVLGFSFLLMPLFFVGPKINQLNAEGITKENCDLYLDTYSLDETPLKNNKSNTYNVTYSCNYGGSTQTMALKKDEIRMYGAANGNKVGSYLTIQSKDNTKINEIYVTCSNGSTKLGYVVDSTNSFTKEDFKNGITYSGNISSFSKSNAFHVSNLSTTCVSIFNTQTSQFSFDNVYVNMEVALLNETPNQITVKNNNVDIEALTLKADSTGLISDLAEATLLKDGQKVVDQAITWESDNPDVISFENGNYTVGAYNEAAKTANITIKSTNVPELKKVIPLTVVDYVNTYSIKGRYIIKNGTNYLGNDFTGVVKEKALPLTFVLADDDTFTIQNDSGLYLTTQDKHSQLKFTEQTEIYSYWRVTLEGEIAGKYLFTNSTGSKRQLNFYDGRFTGYKPGCAIELESLSGLTDKVQNWVDTYLHLNDYDSELNVGKAGQNLCLGDEGYYAKAKAALNALEKTTPGCKDEFKNNKKFNTAQARYEAWGVANDDAEPYNGSTIVKASDLVVFDTNTTIIAIATISIFILGLIGLGLVLAKRKKLD